MLRKIISMVLSFNLILAQSGFCQGAFELNLGQYLGQMNSGLAIDRFRPLHLRYFSYDTATNNFQLLLDKGDNPDIKDEELQDKIKVLMEYFQIGLSLSNDKFWVNLRPDSEDEIIDPLLERTDLGRVMLESDLQLKKDTAAFTSPQSPEGRLYWDKLYQKARELFGSEPANIPTLTRPWIVPGEIIVKETDTSAYIYKANMKVMLEEDYLKTTNPISSGQMYAFSDPRMKELNSYSTQLIREMILPKLTKDVNTAKRYAALRQVFFSLVMARWFKERFRGKSGEYPQTIDSNNLEGLTSKEPWSKSFYFNEYKKSFEKGEYNLKEQVSTISGQVIRSYVSGGQQFERMNISGIGLKTRIVTGLMTLALLLGLTPAEGDARCGSARCITVDIQEQPSDGSKEMTHEEIANRIHDIHKAAKLYNIGLRVSHNDSGKTVLSVLTGIAEYDITNVINFRLDSKGLLVKHRNENRELEYALVTSETGSLKQWSYNNAPPEIRIPLDIKGGASSPIADSEEKNIGNWYEASDAARILLLLSGYNTYNRGLIKTDSSSETLEFLGGLQAVGNKDDGTTIWLGGKEILHHAWNSGDFRVSNTAEGLTTVRLMKDGENRGIVYGVIVYAPNGTVKITGEPMSGEGGYIFTVNKVERGSEVKPDSSSVSSPAVENKLGGIDFRAMDMLIQPMGSFSGLNFSLPVLSAATLEAMDLDKELEDIRNMVKAGVIPSGDRVKEYLAACFQKGKMAEKQDGLLLCLSEIYRLQEEEVLETSPELRESLVIIETGNFVMSS